MWVECYDLVYNLDRADYLRPIVNSSGKYQIAVNGSISYIVVSDPVEWDTVTEAHDAMVKFVHAVDE